jgi:glycerophosphoryl diester phosphodiesterase
LLKNKRNGIFCILILLLAISVGYNIKNIYEKYQTEKLTQHVFSHRGASGEEIEHTFAAYDLAINYGSQYIEQDLVTSKSGTLFVSHDLSAKRMTGIDRLYRDMSDEEISNLKTKDGSSILSLQEIFDNYTNSINYVIELKENDQQTKLFIDIIKKNNLENNVIVQASDVKVLDEVTENFPDMKKLLLVKEQGELEEASDSKNVDIVSANKSLMSHENTNLVHENGKLLNIWTLDSSEEIKEAIDLGVDSYFTNFTAKALQLESMYR